MTGPTCEDVGRRAGGEDRGGLLERRLRTAWVIGRCRPRQSDARWLHCLAHDLLRTPLTRNEHSLRTIEAKAYRQKEPDERLLIL